MELCEELKKQILERVDLSREVSDEEIQELIDEVVLFCGKERHLSLNERCRIKRELFYALRKMDVLQELLEEKSVTEIMVNGTDGIFLEKNGKLSRWEKSFSSKERILDIIQQITGAWQPGSQRSFSHCRCKTRKRGSGSCGTASGCG